MIAELFDEMLGSANLITERAGMTGTLTVRYRAPPPCWSPSTCPPEWTGSEGQTLCLGRAVQQRGAHRRGRRIFIEVNPGRMLDIVTNNAKDSSAPVIDAEFAQMIKQSAHD